MKLHIQVENGNPVNHPAAEENLILVYGVIPNNWELFERVERPRVGVYQILESESPAYQKVEGVWTDVWALHDMTDVEIAAKQQATKAAWEADPDYLNFTTWLFSEDHCGFYPPSPPPNGPNFQWCGPENKWKEAPVKPSTEGSYKFDYAQWIWVAI
jgi:hypothetical protein